MKKKMAVGSLLSIGVVLLLAGCTAAPNSMVGTPAADGVPAGFLLGIWHGFILLFSFIVSLVVPGVGVYEIHNDGLAYNLGFLIGVALFFGGGAGGVGGIRRR